MLPGGVGTIRASLYDAAVLTNTPRASFRSHWSKVRLPISLQRSFLNFVFSSQDVQGSGNGRSTRAQLPSKIGFVNNYVSSRVSLLNFAPVSRNLIGKFPKFPAPFLLPALSADTVGFATPFASYEGDANSTSDCHRTPLI